MGEFTRNVPSDQDRPLLTALSLQTGSESFGKLLDEICALASHLTQAPAVLVARRDPLSKTIKVLGKTGTLVTEVDMSFVIPALHPDHMPVLVSPDIRRDSRFEGHPLLRLMPHVRSLIVMLIPGSVTSTRAVLKIINPRKGAMSDGAVMRALSDLSLIIKDILELESAFQLARESAQSKASSMLGNSLHESTSPLFGSAHDIADVKSSSSFLLETLVTRRRLHSVNGVDYVSLRSWRTPIKKYQMAALAALRESPPAELISSIAEEIAAYVGQAHGQHVIKVIVPVWPARRNRNSALATQVAQQVADRLGARCVDAFDVTERTDAEQPGEPAATLEAGRTMLGMPGGPILLTDVLASSCNQLEKAINACKSPGYPVYAVSWIGQEAGARN